MEIIDELETNRRHIYTGSIGYISFHHTMDLSIAIRTATITQDRLVFSVGGGVVFDSDPDDEYNETLHKGKTMFDAFSGKPGSCDKETWAWLNGALKPVNTLKIPVTDLGFQYGHGFFETLRVDQGHIKFLDEHLERLFTSWKRFFIQTPPDLSFDEIIMQVIRACGLENTVAAVKIIVTAGTRDKTPWDNAVLVMARPYTHRLDVLKKKGLDLITCHAPRMSAMADHKSLNYQYYYLEGKAAQKTGGDESLILNPDGSVSETNTANLFFIKDRLVICPMSDHRLSGIMEQQVKRLLTSWNYTVEMRKIFPAEIKEFDMMFATNSLMGAVAVQSLDGNPCPDCSALCDAINAKVL
jgi:para-aminobenzoate synthetase component 1